MDTTKVRDAYEPDGSGAITVEFDRWLTGLSRRLQHLGLERDQFSPADIQTLFESGTDAREAGTVLHDSLLDEPIPPRKPEANEKVYNLGHFEQMQINLGLQVLTKYLADPDHDDQEYVGVENLDPVVIESLNWMFASHGTVTVIRHDGEDNEPEDDGSYYVDPMDDIPWGTPDSWIPDNPDDNGMRQSDFI